MGIWTEILTHLLTLVTGGSLTAFVTLKAARRKAAAEADGAMVDVFRNAIEALRGAISELKGNQSEANAREDKLNAQLTERDARIEELHKQLADKRCENTTKGYYMCVHQGCVLRCPSLGRGKEYYIKHSGEEDFGADFLTVEELIENRRNAMADGNDK